MHGLAGWLRAHGVEASILAGHTEGRQYTLDTVPYQTVRAWDLRRVQRELGPPVTMIPLLAATLRRLKPDLVHAFSYHDALAAKWAGSPYLISYAGIIAPRSWQRAPWQFKLFQRASASARAIFTPSTACAAAFERDYGLSTELIPYGLHTAPFLQPSVGPVPGRIMCAATPDDARKRPDFLVQAFGRVAEQLPEAHLVFCATASPRTQQRLLQQLPEALRPRVQFLGNVDRDTLLMEYARASLTALTSLEEAFGLVLIESLAAGTPVIGTHSGAIPELIDASVGGTFAPEDVEGCAQQMLQLLTSPSGAYREACLQRARRYDWDAVGPRILHLYQRCVSS